MVSLQAWTDSELKLRLTVAMVFMIVSKGAGLLAPLLFKEAVDFLSYRGCADAAAKISPTLTHQVVQHAPFLTPGSAGK